jgi:hypothetical protein
MDGPGHGSLGYSVHHPVQVSFFSCLPCIVSICFQRFYFLFMRVLFPLVDPKPESTSVTSYLVLSLDMGILSFICCFNNEVPFQLLFVTRIYFFLPSWFGTMFSWLWNQLLPGHTSSFLSYEHYGFLPRMCTRSLPLHLILKPFCILVTLVICTSSIIL